MSVPHIRFLLLAVIAATLPLSAHAQIPAGCHPITAEERAALELRDVVMPTSGFFCDADRALLFGSCASDPLPILLARYTPGTLSSQEGRRGITKLQPEFACRLSKFLTTYPHCIVSGWRSNETQQKLWDEALVKYGSETEARKFVAPPGKSRHNTGLAVDVCPLSPAAKSALAGAGLYIRLEYEPWHVEGIGLTDNQSGIEQAPSWVSSQNASPSAIGTSGSAAAPSSGSWLSNLASLYSLARGVETILGGSSNLSGSQGYAITQVGSTYYVAATTSAAATVSLADVLLATLQGSDAPTIVFTTATSSITITPETLSSLLSAPGAAQAAASPAPLSIDDRIRELMLRVIELMRTLIERLASGTA